MEAPPNSHHPATFAPAASRPVQRTVLEQYLGQLNVIDSPQCQSEALRQTDLV